MLRKILDNINEVSQKNKLLRLFKPVITATDEFFFGTDKVTALPHVVDRMDVKRYMSFVIVALLPALAASVYFWGPRVIWLVLVSYFFGGLVEAAFAIVRKREIHEGFLVTGLIFPLTLPPTVPFWAVAVGVMFGVIFGKEVFGGTGRNIFNPAITGRIFLSIAFPKLMAGSWIQPFFYQNRLDAVTSATPLALFKSKAVEVDIYRLLFGNSAGCIGETFRIGLIIGGVFLIWTKISNWRLPLSAFISVIGFSFLGHHFAPDKFASPVFQIFSGGLLLGVFFMASDPVTSPFTRAGKWIGGAVLGFLIVLIRALSGYTEGVMFSILLLNVFTPLFDRMALDIKYPKIVK